MHRIATAALCLLLAHPGAAPAAPWVSGYYASYSEAVAGMAPDQFDYTALTHVIHWPVVPRSDGTLVDPATYGMTAAQSATVVARARAAGTKALLGFGGDVASVGEGWRGATTPGNRARLVANMVGLMRERGYDGIDINWEGLVPADEPQFAAFVGELRAALDAIQPRPLLTWVPTTGWQAPVSATAATMQHFDQINLQTYVMSGPYPGWVTWFNSPLYSGGAVFPSTGGALPSVDAEVARYRAAGVPAARLGIGVQFDGFVWSGGRGTTTGGVSAPRQVFDDTAAPAVTVLRHAEVLAQYGAAPGCRRFFDAVARVPWIGCDRINDADDRFVSFDDEAAIGEKARYVAQQDLGGLFVFELSGDFRPGESGSARHPLLAALKAALRVPAPPQNLLGLAAGSEVVLSWLNGTGGGTPAALRLDVGSGAAQASFTLPVGESFRHAGVPPGRYHLTLSAVNDAGSSAPSNAIVLDFPTPCSGVPGVPTGLQLARSGSTLSVSWLPPAQGPALTGYEVRVSGTYVGSFATTERAIGGSVPPGTYGISVSAINPCGSGAATPALTASVP